MKARIITGVILAAGLIAVCLYGPLWLIYGALQLAAIIGLLELLKMAGEYEPTTCSSPLGDRVGALLVGTLLPAMAYFAPDLVLPVVLLAPVLVLGSFLLAPHPIETVGRRMATAVTVVFYIGLLFAALIHLATHSAGADSGRALLLLGAMVFLGDTGAFFFGKYFGRRKLYPLVSPSKTWMGALGGVLGSLLGATAFKLVLAAGLTWGDVLALALPCAVLGQVGDLTESLFKRSYGVKDSGGLLPGHGGVLDRMDGILFAAPYMLFYAFFFGLDLV